MKNQYQLAFNHDIYKHKILANTEQQFYPSAKRAIKSNTDISHNKSLLYHNYLQEQPYKSMQLHEKSAQNPQKNKSTSLHEKPKTFCKIDYLSYAQRQYKEEKKGQEKAIDMKQLTELKMKMQNYFVDLQKKDEVIIRMEKQINQKDRQIQQSTQKIGLLQDNCNRLQHSYNSLHQQLRQSQQYYSSILQNHNSLSEKCALLEHILQQKDAFIQKIIASKDQQYSSAIKSKNNEIQALQQRLNILETENSLLMNKINELQSGKNSPINIDLSLLGQQFETKINFYVNQNSQLKNTICQYEGQIEHLQTQKQSLQATLQAYQQRDRGQKASVFQQELIFLRDALQHQKEEKDIAVSKYQLEILKLQNALSYNKLQIQSNLLDLFDQQRLRENLYVALQEVERLRMRVGEKAKQK